MSNKNKDLDTDPFIEFLEQAKEWIEKNKNLIFSAVAIAAIVFAGYSGFSYMQNQKLAKAREAFGSATSFAITNQYDKAVAALKTVMEDYPGTVFEAYSAFMAGNLLLQKEQYKEAQKLLEVAAGASGKVGFIKGEAIENIATCFESSGDNAQALEYYKKALKEKTAAHRYAAIKWKIALLENKNGNNETALKYCDEIISDTTAQVYKKQAENLKTTIEAL